jgi:ABC-type dipeptide/oligopeptide/nickel transport system permease subunit
VAQELAKTALLLALMLLTLWGVLEILRAAPPAGSLPERIWNTVAGARVDRNGLPIAPRFWAAAARSLAIVAAAAVALAVTAMALGSLFALRPAWSVLRLGVVLVSAVPAFMFPFLGVPHESAWFWPAVCLAIGDLNAAALTGHCYEGIRRELNQPYVRTALAQGLSVWSDLWPRGTLIALEGIRARIPHLLGGTVAIEWAYNIHGVGNLALTAVVSERPDYNVLIWVAGLGIVMTRVLSLLHRLAQAVLTPERGKRAAWSDPNPGAGLLGLWRRAPGAWRGETLPDPAPNSAAWLSAAEPPLSANAGRWTRLTQRLRAFWALSSANRAKMVLAAVIAFVGALLVAAVAWQAGTGDRQGKLLDTDTAFLPASQTHLLGTNAMGEDVLTTIALGGRELAVPLAAALAVAIVLGGFFGTLSGLCRGSAADAAMDLYAELWESIPKLVLVLAAVTYISFEHYALKIYVLIGLAFAPLVYRSVRDAVGALRTSLFLEASLALGIPRRRILWVHVLRNHALPVLCVDGAVMAGYVLLFDAILGYCRVRQYGEVFTWGSLLGTGLDDLPRYLDAGEAANPLIVWGPLAAMLIAIICSQIVGDALKSLGRSVRFSR